MSREPFKGTGNGNNVTQREEYGQYSFTRNNELEVVVNQLRAEIFGVGYKKTETDKRSGTEQGTEQGTSSRVQIVTPVYVTTTKDKNGTTHIGYVTRNPYGTNDNYKQNNALNVESAKNIKKQKERVYVTKRNFFAIASLVISSLLILLTIMGVASNGLTKLFKITAHDGLATFLPIATGYAGGAMVFPDPMFSVLKAGFGIVTGNAPVNYARYLQTQPDTTGKLAAEYVIIIATLVYIVCAIVILVGSAVALTRRKRQDGTYKKVKLGWASVTMLVSVILMHIGLVSALGGNFRNLFEFLGGNWNINAGAMYYVLLCLPIVTFVCNLLCFGEQRKNKQKI